MKKITDDIGQTAGLIHDLGRSSAEIGKIVNVIQGIAFQTNLLALNAAVEAASTQQVAQVAAEMQVMTSELQELISHFRLGARETLELPGEPAGVRR
jgi:methyl-accepting chemotaxis protein